MPEATTKNLVDIAAIRDDVILLKNGSLRSLIEVSAINFELRSTNEQTAIVQNFQNLLNSIDFPLQIVSTSRRLSLDDYVKNLDATIETLDNELLKIQAAEYAKFVSELAELSNIMAKKFYVVVPFYATPLQTTGGLFSGITGIFSSKKPTVAIDDTSVAKYRSQLMQRVDLVFSNLVGLGLKAKLLKGDDLMNLFYQIYNPGSKTKFNTEGAEISTP